MRPLGGTSVYDGAAIAAADLCFREGLWRSAPLDAVHEAEVRSRQFGPILATAFGDLPRLRLMNLVQGAAEADAIDSGHLSTAIDWMRSREVDYLVSVLTDRPGSERAESWLASRGYERDSTIRRFLHPGMQGPESIDPGPLEIAELGPLDTEGMDYIFGTTFNLPCLASLLLMGLPTQAGWRCYSASLGGREVATGSMLILGRVALLGLDATLTEARNHGCQTALITRRLTDATKLGCNTIVAEVCPNHPASPAAVRNLLGIGFEEIPGKVNWRRPHGLA
jgi:hypothetical protein